MAKKILLVLLLVLVSADNLCHARNISRLESDATEYVPVTIKAVLGYSYPNQIGAIPQYVLFYDH